MLAVDELFFQIIEAPAAERAALIEQLCAQHPELERELRELCQAHERNQDQSFVLDRPVVPPTLWRESSTVDRRERLGDVIDRYKLLEKIGEGGMGEVYMAEQVAGVHRRVALKIIKLGMDTRQVIARFEAERQALAMFDHPNITRVLDAGATSAGRPYFVMELVRGRNIVDFANRQKLTLHDRLRLFREVCHAVQHAHQKGIIHRDLKPSNILVSLQEGRAIPKVIDFGIAKAIHEQRLTDKTLFTKFSALLGTPQYMSPEQAEMSGRDVDTRSDIYSLGVILYELITGSTPISANDLREVSPLALHETIRDANWETPSNRLERTRTRTTTRSEEPTANMPLALPRGSLNELDWVVLKALAQEREKRYASAHEFSEDVGRFLAGEPVLAAPPSRVSQLRAYLRRHWKVAASTAAFFLLLTVATSLCLWLAIQANRANRELRKVNNSLSENVAELEQAKSKLREAADLRHYQSAISIAILKFEMECYPRIFQIAQELYPLQDDMLAVGRVPGAIAILDNVTDDTEVTESTTGNSEGNALPQPQVARPLPLAESATVESEGNVDVTASVIVDQSLNFCWEIDRHQLLKLSRPEELRIGLKRIQDHFQQEEEIMSRVLSMSGNETGEGVVALNHVGHEHTAECLKLQTALLPILQEVRPVFYRELVAQYRKSFGDNDPRVAEALMMLAVSLWDNKEIDEAESRLREVLVIDQGSYRRSAEEWLKQIHKEKNSPAIRLQMPTRSGGATSPPAASDD